MSHGRSEEHTSELQSRQYLVCRLLLEKKKYSILRKFAILRTTSAYTRRVACTDTRRQFRSFSASWLLNALLRIFAMTIISLYFFFNDTATTEIYTLSLHDALPICHLLWHRALHARDEWLKAHQRSAHATR